MTMVKRSFNAELKGAFIPEGLWKGRIRSTYSRAINLLHPSGILISIVNSIDYMTDYGLTITNFNSLLSGVPNGCQFLWEGDRIIFPDMIVDISRASVWSGTLFKAYSKLSIDIIPIKSAFIEFAMEEGLSPVITKKKGNLYSDAAGKLIEKAVETADISDGLLIDPSLLIGMGIGFTPSGDDFLVGIMLYETISGVNLINRESVKSKLSQTTIGGKTLLMLALRNSYPSYLKQFAESMILSENEIQRKSNIKNAVIAALDHGSTSGGDSLAGFIWAAERNRKLQP
ncbi:MAG: DUF2877 domain-containing protein [Spirochaetales bacterium]|nr:DUF2877 domain-containing protein [Spirochaetales bacterium]